MINLNKTILVLMVALSLSSCSIAEHNTTVKSGIKLDQNEAVDLRAYKSEYSNIAVSNQIYVEQISREAAVKPAWYFDNDSYHYSNVPLHSILSSIFSGENISHKYVDGTNRNKLASLDLSNGKRGDALEYLAANVGYSFQIENSTIVWSQFETASFDIAMFPGDNTFGIGKNGDSAQSLGEEDGASIISSADEFSHVGGKLTVFEDIKRSLDSLKSENGKLSYSESYSSVTVKDYPMNVRAIKTEIERINERLNRMVSIDMEVIDVVIKDEVKGSLDWSIITKQLGSKDYILGAASGMANTVSSNVAPMLISAGIGKGRASGTTAMVELLKAQGGVSRRSLPRVVTLHNRVTKLRNVNTQDIVSERTITNTVNSGSEVGIKQKTIETGFSMFALPTIVNGDVVMRLTTNMSTLLGVDKKDLGTGVNDSENESTALYIESARIADKDFDNTVIIPHGQSLIIAGLSSMRRQQQHNNAGVDALGFAIGAEEERVETIIVITPTILRGSRG
ncbi:type II secretion system protein GspD [Photobacterium kishitanii]|uniref:type II secretion system protein GspD n=1 Tax=Photobacterium kishitanii TaxID=318456 RepID=UPI0007F9336B|nr:hypothetical protein [Photobacterium kishitanii]OBU31243.1 hypothetical protein AYY23_20230 [Photobacterium kishitanii]PSW46659.1 hypothetical protein C0W66_22265 [Photobacterium kishitanii]